MSDNVVLDLPLLLPDALDGRDRCVERLTETLSGAPGLDEVHVLEAADGAPARLCLHYDPGTTDVARIRRLAESGGARLTEQFGHVLWTVTGIGHARKARTVAESLRRLAGVVEAEVTGGLVRVEFDRRQVEEDRLRKTLAEHGVHASSPDDDTHAGHDHGSGAHDHGGPFGERSELIFAITSAVLWTTGFVLELTTDVGNGDLTPLFIASGLFGGYFTLREAYESVRNRRFEIDFLMLVAAAGAWGLGKWEEGALLLALFSTGHALEGYAMGRARRAIEALAALAPDTAVVRRGGG
ncbi:MAG TPA: heavy metal translocating P-type ATPase, partial [Acidimicrobiaceae bacterium]|nr:heavy metal translocating P-type ATPase [Acidimicrobiaceae bacterium]